LHLGKLSEVGIDDEVFAEACRHHRFSRDVNKSVYEQMTAMDDFLTFKKLMVRRNKELELEAVRALQHSNTAVSVPKSKEEAEEEFQAALKASHDLSPAERIAMMKENGGGKGKGEDGDGTKGKNGAGEFSLRSV
jgi:hypothetical protein